MTQNEAYEEIKKIGGCCHFAGEQNLFPYYGAPQTDVFMCVVGCEITPHGDMISADGFTWEEAVFHFENKWNKYISSFCNESNLVH